MIQFLVEESLVADDGVGHSMSRADDDGGPRAAEAALQPKRDEVAVQATLVTTTQPPPPPLPNLHAIAERYNITRFVKALADTELLEKYIDVCESPVTIFAPVDAAFDDPRTMLPDDKTVLRELLCIHMTLGELSHVQLLVTRSITTIGQQTHHVDVSADEKQVMQVGSASIVATDIALPDGKGIVHVIDSVQCYIRLLVSCRYEQVWNKTVRPPPSVGLIGGMRTHTDELHAILIRCDSWQPRLDGLRGSIVGLGGTGSERSHRNYSGGIVTFSDLLILEKPPDMPKKRKRLANGERAADDVRDQTAGLTKFRLMYSLFRRHAAVGPGDPPSDPQSFGTAAGRHVSFLMSPDDILIRNSFHMLTEGEKAARRAEYRQSSDNPPVRSQRLPKERVHEPQSVVAVPQETRPTKPPEVLVPDVSNSHLRATALPRLSSLSPGVIGSLSPLAAAAAQNLPLALPEELSAVRGPSGGGTSVWVRGRSFLPTLQVQVDGVAAHGVRVHSESLALFSTPPAAGSQNCDAAVRLSNAHDGGWSNPLPFRYETKPDTDLVDRQLKLLAGCFESVRSATAADALLQLDAGEPPVNRLLAASIAQLLSSGGASAVCKARDDEGKSLLHYACASHNGAAAKLLLGAGLDPSEGDEKGVSARELAALSGFALEGPSGGQGPQGS